MEQHEANLWLALFALNFWGLFTVGVKFSNWWAGRSWNDGPSLIPVIPCFPVAAMLLGLIINTFAAPWGLWVIVGLHLSGLAVMSARVWFYLSEKATKKP